MSLPARAPAQTQFNILKIAVFAALIGAIGALIAELLHQLIGLVTNLAFYGRWETHIVSPLESPLGPGIIFVPAIGGLLIGLLARYGTPLVRGHGIPEAMEAVLLRRSRIPARVALFKPISAAISIGSGGPFGAEGPIIQTGAAIGSLIGQALHTTNAERKVLLACGAAAGLAATFGTPIAAVIFAIELLLFEFRTRSFIALVIASTVATGVHMGLFNSESVFTVTGAEFGSPINLVFFVVLGVLSGLTANALTRLLYRVEDLFHRLPINTYLWPALGGLFVGIVGYLTPRLTGQPIDVFGPGYEVIHNILNGEYVIGFLVLLLFSKSAVWLVSLGSGTSGGTLAPVLMIGATLGGIFGLLLKQVFPALDAAPTAFAVAGMAAVFGSSTRATFASIVFVFEITRSYDTILPVMLASVIASAVARHLMHTSLLTEQLHRKGMLVEQEYEANPLGMIHVRDVMDDDPVLVPESMPLRTLAEEIRLQKAEMIRHQAACIIDANGRLTGILTRNDILRTLTKSDSALVGEAGTAEVVVAYPDEPVREAMYRMLQADIGRLPVVDRAEPTKIVGYLSRANVIEAHMQSMRDEADRDSGWLQTRLRMNW